MLNKIICLFLVFLPLVGFAQEERYVKVNGTSEMQLDYDSIQIILEVSEIKRDEFNKIREKSMEEVMSELDANLRSIGHSSEDLILVWPPSSSSNFGRKSKNAVRYIFYVKDIEMAKEVYDFHVNGLLITNMTYIYTTYPSDIANTLRTAALKDAEAKAKYLAKVAGKKIGRVINIVDTDRNNEKTQTSEDEGKTIVKYRIIVSYELLD